MLPTVNAPQSSSGPAMGPHLPQTNLHKPSEPSEQPAHRYPRRASVHRSKLTTQSEPEKDVDKTKVVVKDSDTEKPFEGRDEGDIEAGQDNDGNDDQYVAHSRVKRTVTGCFSASHLPKKRKLEATTRVVRKNKSDVCGMRGR